MVVVKTNISIAEALYKKLKHYCIETGQSMSETINVSLCQFLSEHFEGDKIRTLKMLETPKGDTKCSKELKKAKKKSEEKKRKSQQPTQKFLVTQKRLLDRQMKNTLS